MTEWMKVNELIILIEMSTHCRISVQPVLARVIRPVRQDMVKKATDAFVLAVSMEINAS